MDVLEAVRTTLIMAFRAFPLLMIGFIGFLAIGLGNLGLFMLFIGHAIVVPISTSVIQRVAGMALKDKPPPATQIYSIPATYANQLAYSPTTSGSINITPSYWMMHVTFLFGYIMMNSILLSVAPHDGVDPIIVDNIRSKCYTIMVTTLFFLGIIVGLRISTGTENRMGVGIALFFGLGLGLLWYKIAEICGASAADVFGIAQQILPNSAKEAPPMTCVYAPKP